MTRLGKYELFESLGSGATAEVYHARDTVLGREVALKILKPALVADPSAFERFVKEAQAAAGLFHPNIATVLDMGEAEGRYFIAMRYIAGQSLDKVLKEKSPLSWEETLRMAQQIGAALDFAHEQGFLHRDVKPSNIIRTPKGDFILTDFGLQRAMQSTGLTSHTGAILGTPAYIAPEVWEGKPALPTTDQYALACVVYEALTGQVLFAGETPPAVMKSHFDERPLPSTWPRGVPAGVEQVLGNALARHPEDRCRSMKEFALALERLTHVPLAHPETVPPKEKPAPQKPAAPRGASPALPAVLRYWPIALVAGLLIVGGLALALIFALLQGPGHGATPAATEPHISTQTSTKNFIPTELPTEAPASTVTPTETPASTVTPTETPAAEITDARGVAMRLVPAGSFTMGDSADIAYTECQKLYIGGTCNRDFFTDEEPAHTVYLDAFYMDKYEVSNAAYRVCVNSGACQPPTVSSSYIHSSYYGNPTYDVYPVVDVTWDMANAYCGWRSARLPSEAEWEKAARGPDGRMYPWGNTFDGRLANFCDANCPFDWPNKSYNDGYTDTAPVDAFPGGASVYGIFNLAGNVWEWVADWYDASYYANSPASNPQGPASGQVRVLRGGSWGHGGSNVRSADRSWDDPSLASGSVGFRCSRSP